MPLVSARAPDESILEAIATAVVCLGMVLSCRVSCLGGIP